MRNRKVVAGDCPVLSGASPLHLGHSGVPASLRASRPAWSEARVALRRDVGPGVQQYLGCS